MHQLGSSVNYSLSESGTETSSGTESGDSLKGTYSLSQTGSDSYNMTETGYAYGSGSWTQTVQGSETNTLTETGDKPDQTFQRSASGSGGYSMTETGPGATTPGGSGGYAYGLTESGDWKAASLSLSETGSDRYKILHDFVNVSNTTPGSGPGDLDYSPFGTPFSDAPPIADQEFNVLWNVIGSPHYYSMPIDPDDIEEVASRLGYSYKETENLIEEYLSLGRAEGPGEAEKGNPPQVTAGSPGLPGGFWLVREGIGYPFSGFWSDLWYIRVSSPNKSELSQPLPPKLKTDTPLNQPLPQDLKMGDSIDPDSKLWAREANRYVGIAAATVAINVGPYLIPVEGPFVAWAGVTVQPTSEKGHL